MCDCLGFMFSRLLGSISPHVYTHFRGKLQWQNIFHFFSISWSTLFFISNFLYFSVATSQKHTPTFSPWHTHSHCLMNNVFSEGCGGYSFTEHFLCIHLPIGTSLSHWMNPKRDKEEEKLVFNILYADPNLHTYTHTHKIEFFLSLLVLIGTALIISSDFITASQCMLLSFSKYHSYLKNPEYRSGSTRTCVDSHTHQQL